MSHFNPADKLQRSDYYFDLPECLIAQTPCSRRGGSRLLMLNKQQSTYEHHKFRELPDLLTENDFLVLNDTQVIPARLYAVKDTGGKVEILIERVLTKQRAWAHLGASKPLKIGSRIQLDCGIEIEVLSRRNGLYLCHFYCEQSILSLLDEFGSIPLPPYIKRELKKSDQVRYQTIYAKNKGAIAAPTAGLHFNSELFQQLKDKGIDYDFITLHVGAGTFKPVKHTDITQHKMHSEWVNVNQDVCDKINKAKAQGRRIIAVGTTVVRCLEALSKNNSLSSYQGDINLFIYPGYQFNMVDGMLTNFHTPESSLLVLVCAFAGYQLTMSTYQAAITAKYRFYSYGDAMLIL